MLDHRLAERLAELEASADQDGADIASLPIMAERDIPDSFATPPPRTVS